MGSSDGPFSFALDVAECNVGFSVRVVFLSRHLGLRDADA